MPCTGHGRVQTYSMHGRSRLTQQQRVSCARDGERMRDADGLNDYYREAYIQSHGTYRYCHITLVPLGTSHDPHTVHLCEMQY